MNNSSVIGFVGLTHLGINYLAATSEKKFNVYGFDSDELKIARLNNYQLENSEPNLINLIKKNKKRINFTNNFKLLKKCNIVFISQDVQTNALGQGNLSKVRNLINITKKNLSKKSILVVLSQLQPGFMRKVNFSKHRLYYQVETLIFGQGVNRALKPERIILGCQNQNHLLQKNYLSFLKKFNCPILKMSYESAEITKIAINIFLASSITTTNVLSEVCSKISADWREIVPALQLDARIGKKAYLNPGLGISGGNIERDISSVKKIVKASPILTSLVGSFEKNSNYMKSWVFRKLIENKILNKKNITFSILGLSYKENTNSIKNSPSIKLIKQLKNENIKIYDPIARMPKKIKNCEQASSIKQALTNANVLIIMTPWSEFKRLNTLIRSYKKISLIIDPHGIINCKHKNKNLFKYLTLGN